MGRSHTVVQFASKHQHRLASAFPDFVPTCHLTSGAFCAPAQPADQLQRPDETEPALTLHLAERLALLTESRRLRDRRQSRAASTSEARLRAVTHEILRMELGF